jgi:thioredoxin-dependent peroxiredoxin
MKPGAPSIGVLDVGKGKEEQGTGLAMCISHIAVSVKPNPETPNSRTLLHPFTQMPHTICAGWLVRSQLEGKQMGFKTKNQVKVGSEAPDFVLPSQTGEIVSLDDFIGKKPVVLFFYPKDNTPGCTKQACTFRDAQDQFEKLDVEVIGISSDSVKSHRSFAERYSLPFTLLSDEGGRVRRLYGVANTFGLFPGRVTYVIDREGIVRHIFSSQVGVERHVEEALKVLQHINW